LFIGLLTVVMVVDCLILIFLVLIQLPKKDAGAGLGFWRKRHGRLVRCRIGHSVDEDHQVRGRPLSLSWDLLSVLQSITTVALRDNLVRRSALPRYLPQSDAAAKSPAVGTNAATLGSATNSLPGHG